MEYSDVVIVGAGHGGAQAAIALRKNNFAGSIAMIDDASEHPYERPPLSKDYLAGEKAFERFQIRPADFWQKNSVNLKLGSKVQRLGDGKRSIVLENGHEISFGNLIWSAGGEARQLSCAGSDSNGVHVLRNKCDADRLKADLEKGATRALIVGGGYIGLEAAAVLTKLGLEVTVVETFARVLSRVAGAEVSEFFQVLHRCHGVELLLETHVERLESKGGRVAGVVLTDGRRIFCDLVIVGIGIKPNVGPLLAEGADGEQGVLVDALCRTSLDNIYAIGDCAEHANSYACGAIMRVESVQNAADMAETVAKSICGEDVPYAATPWFWSHQYDVKLQTVGISAGYDQTILRGEPSDGKFSVIYLRHGQVAALDCINNMKDFVQGRKLVEAKAVIDREIASNINIQLKDLID